MGYRFAIRKLPVSSYEAYHDLLVLMDYVMLDCEEIDISKARIYFNKVYPDIKLCASNIPKQRHLMQSVRIRAALYMREVFTDSLSQRETMT